MGGKMRLPGRRRPGHDVINGCQNISLIDIIKKLRQKPPGDVFVNDDEDAKARIELPYMGQPGQPRIKVLSVNGAACFVDFTGIP